MCCFSRPVDRVSGTRIFARSSKDGRQFLVYSMMLEAKEQLAMILPLPTPKAPQEDAVKFINLEKYPKFFADVESGFPRPQTRSDRPPPSKKVEEAAPKLKVVEVGSFEASFVPTVKDFSRLDERFRLPADVWEKLGHYKDYAFAVFKLKAGKQHVHPMAFEFPRAKAEGLFFPTVHIHDGKVHDRAMFDHVLYLQLTGEEMLSSMDWEESPQHARSFVKIDQTQGVMLADAHVYRHELRGRRKNEDVIV